MNETLPNDHDLLITLNVRVQDLIDTIKKMDGVIARDLGGLKEGKLDKTIFSTYCANHEKDSQVVDKEIKTIWQKHDEHSKDIKRLNWIIAVGIGILSMLQFIAPFAINNYLNK